MGLCGGYYPHYGSGRGGRARGAGRPCLLIGPGVHASHGMERTHWGGMKNTIQLAALYLECAVRPMGTRRAYVGMLSPPQAWKTLMPGTTHPSPGR